MFFLFHAKCPRFRTTPYEKVLSTTLKRSDVLGWPPQNYNQLYNLNMHVSRIAKNLHELEPYVYDKGLLRNFDTVVNLFVNEAITTSNFTPQHSNRLRNCETALNGALQADKPCLNCSLRMNAMLGLFLDGVGVAGMVLFGLSMILAPTLEIALVALAMTLVSIFMVMLATYTLYVDLRIIDDKQLTEIKSSVDFLIGFVPPASIVSPEVVVGPSASSGANDVTLRIPVWGSLR